MRATMKFLILVLTTLLAFLSLQAPASVQESGSIDHYLIQPGDVLQVSVWKEEDLTQPAIVRPDGNISFPLAGELKAAGASVDNLRELLTERLKKYIPDPVVTVSVLQLTGNTIYVIGKVNRPGAFPIVRNVDVMQALSLAGGTSTYASLNNIKILRRKDGKLSAIPFEYGKVEKGKGLEQNIILKAGDVVVVP